MKVTIQMTRQSVDRDELCTNQKTSAKQPDLMPETLSRQWNKRNTFHFTPIKKSLP